MQIHTSYTFFSVRKFAHSFRSCSMRPFAVWRSSVARLHSISILVHRLNNCWFLLINSSSSRASSCACNWRRKGYRERNWGWGVWMGGFQLCWGPAAGWNASSLCCARWWGLVEALLAGRLVALKLWLRETNKEWRPAEKLSCSCSCSVSACRSVRQFGQERPSRRSHIILFVVLDIKLVAPQVHFY